MTTDIIPIEQDTYVIVFHDKSILEISESQQDALLKASTSTNKFIKINGNTINFAGINKILPLGEYYREYPDKIPEQRSIFKREDYEELTIRETWEHNLKRAEGIKKGLLESIKENDTQKKQDLLASVDKVIENLE